MVPQRIRSWGFLESKLYIAFTQPVPLWGGTMVFQSTEISIRT
jgi:hypothetical protein